MKKLILGLLVGTLSQVGFARADVQVETFPFVTANPSFTDLGEVSSPGSRMTFITFMNNSREPVQFFNVYCSGDLSEFMCNSSCFSLSAFGSCSVMVTFYPRFSDGMRKSVNVNGSGSGAFANAVVYGTDARKP